MKLKHTFKKTTSLYLIATILGIVCIGLGCGISVFELSEYKIADYRAIPADPAIPQLETQTITLEAPLDGNGSFQLDATDWYLDGGYDIQYDNELTDTIILEVTAPKELYNISLSAQNKGENYYFLHCAPDELSLFRFALALAKDGYIPENYPPVKLKLTMSEKNAKGFQLNERRYAEQELHEQINEIQQQYHNQLNTQQQEYNEQLNTQRQDYEQQLNDRQQEYNDNLNRIQEEYNQNLNNMQQEYQNQLDEKESEISLLQQQLNEAKNALT